MDIFEVLQSEMKLDQIKPNGSQPSDLGTHFAAICGLGQFFLILWARKQRNASLSESQMMMVDIYYIMGILFVSSDRSSCNDSVLF